MRRMSRGLVAALEDENLDNTPVADELPPAAETLETELLDVQDEGAEGEVQETEVADAVEVAEALESYAVALQEDIGNGGLDRTAARYMQMGLESLYLKAGIRRPQTSLSLESFGGTGTRIGSSQLALEGIKEEAKKLWEKIVAAIKRAIEWVMGYYNKIFGAAEKLQKRAEAVKSAAETTTGDQKETKIDNGGLFKKLYKGSAVPTSMAGEATELRSQVESVASAVAADKTAEGLTTALGSLEAAKKFAVPAHSGGDKVGEEQGFPGEIDGTVLYRTKEHLGGKAFVSRMSPELLTGEAALLAYAKFRTDVMAFNPKATEPTGTSITALKSGDVVKTAAAIEAVGASIAAGRKALKTIEDALKKVASAAEKAASGAADDEDAESKKISLALKKAAGNVVNAEVSAFNATNRYALETGKAILDLCELSLKTYGKKD